MHVGGQREETYKKLQSFFNPLYKLGAEEAANPSNQMQFNYWSSAMVWSSRVCVNAVKRCRGNSNYVREAMLLYVSLERCMRPFPSNLWSITPQWERLCAIGKHSRLLPVLSGVNVPASSLQGQTVKLTDRESQENRRSRISGSTNLHWWNLKVQDGTVRKRTVQVGLVYQACQGKKRVMIKVGRFTTELQNSHSLQIV